MRYNAPGTSGVCTLLHAFHRSLREKQEEAMNLFHLRYFVELAHTKHYTKTAQKLRITQPNLSYAINQLEEELGVPLFEKKRGHRTELTLCGERFLFDVENALQGLDKSVDYLKKNARGEGVIRLGLLRPLGVELMPRLTAEFLKQQEGKNIQFIFDIERTPSLLEGLQNRRYDMVFCSQPEKKELFDSRIIATQELVLIVPPDHPLAQNDSIDLKKTAPYPYIFFGKDAGLRYVIEQKCREIGFTPKVAYEVDEDQVIAGLVAHSFGIAIVPYMELLTRLSVKIISIENPSWVQDVYMVWNKDLYMLPAAQAFQTYVSSIQESLSYTAKRDTK